MRLPLGNQSIRQISHLPTPGKDTQQQLLSLSSPRGESAT